MVQSKLRTTIRSAPHSGIALIRRGSGKLRRACVLALAVLFAATGVQAHSFSLAVVAVGDGAAVQLDSAVKGILLATRERDGHANEESDGHLGGLDVYIVLRPSDTAQATNGLVGASPAIVDIAVVLGPDAAAERAVAEFEDPTVVIRPGTLAAESANDFATRYETTYGTAPDRAAAEGYNAARRVDLAVRPLGGVEDRDALIAALAETSGGIKW